MIGWFKIHRKIVNNPIFKNAELYQLYSYCLAFASYEENETFFGADLITLKAGQFVTGRYKISEAINQNHNSTYKRLKKLEKLGYISTKCNNKSTLITVLNWGLYQLEDEKVTTKEQQSNNKVTTKEQQSNTTKELKKLKELKELKDSCEKIVNFYHEHCTLMPRLRIITDKRIKAVGARIKEHSVETVMQVIESASKIGFLNGDNDRGWVSDLDWLMNPTNFLKVLEGKYKNKPSSRGQQNEPKQMNNFKQRDDSYLDDLDLYSNAKGVEDGEG